MKPIVPACIAFLLVTVLQCTPRPVVGLGRTERMSAKELVQTSGIIVVGTVAKIEPVGGDVPISSSKMSARLKKVTVSPEIVIKGQANQEYLVFHRFDCTIDCSQIDYPSWLPEGSRRVFFLTEGNGMLRAKVDLRASDIPVLSGRRTLPMPKGNDLEAVAQVLLQPGPEMDPKAFADNLFNDRAVSQELVGRAGTLKLVAPLLSYAFKTVEIQACLILAEAMYDYNGCLHRLVNDPKASEGQRRRIAKRISGLNENLKQLRKAFVNDPMPWIRASSTSEQPNDITDLLRILAGHPDPLVRRRSCEILKASFGSVKETACTSP